MRVLITPAKDGNPYITLTLNALKASGVDAYVASAGRVLPLWRAARKGKPADIIHLQWQHEFFVSMFDRSFLRSLYFTLRFYLQFLLLRLRGVRFVWTVHNLVNHEQVHAQWELLNCRILAKLVDKLIVHCPEARLLVATTYKCSSERLHVVPHGDMGAWYPSITTRHEARQQLGLHTDQRILLFFGMIRPYKGVENLLDAFKRIESEDVQLLIVGSPKTPSLASQLQDKAALDSRVRLHLSYVEDELLIQYIRASNCVILPYTDFLTSGAIYSAAALSRCSVIPKLNCMRQFPTEAVLFFDPDAVDGLQHGLQSAMELAIEELDCRGDKAYQHIQQFPWSRVAEATRTIYEAC